MLKKTFITYLKNSSLIFESQKYVKIEKLNFFLSLLLVIAHGVDKHVLVHY